MTILGVDIGYTYTKTSEGILFASKVCKAEPFQDAPKLTWEGQTYSVGVGESTVDANKINSTITKVCMMAALAVSSKDSEFNIVTGLPIGQFSAQADNLKSMILSNRRNKVFLNGVERNLNINDVKIYAQGAGALFAQRIDGEAIIIDIGGRTIDIAYFEIEGGRRRLSTHSTLYCGMLPLYSKAIEAINQKYELTLPSKDSEKILRDGLEVHGEKQDIRFINTIKNEHIQELVNELDVKYPSKTTPIYITGGGAFIFGAVLQDKYRNARILPNCQFSNANGFKQIGESIWQN